MASSPDPTAASRLVAQLSGVTADQAESALLGFGERLDWQALPRRIDLPDGAHVQLDPKRRSGTVRGPGRGTFVVDLGRRDRMRKAHEVLTPGLTVDAGPVIDGLKEIPYIEGTGEVSVRDPLDPKGKHTRDFLPAGPVPVARLLDARGVPQLVAYGDLSSVTGFGTTTMNNGSAYGSLKSVSGLAAVHDSRRTSFKRAVTGAHAEQARAEGFASVVTKGGVIGVVVDLGRPGHHVVLAVYGGERGGTVGYVVDLRRPPVKDGAIVDPE
jgi:hypothetical protein